jgi:hypothetical protein
MFVRLEEFRNGLVAISDRDAEAKIAGRPMIFLVWTKEESPKTQSECDGQGFRPDPLPIIDKS